MISLLNRTCGDLYYLSKARRKLNKASLSTYIFSFDLFILYFFVYSYVFRHKSYLSPSKWLRGKMCLSPQVSFIENFLVKTYFSGFLLQQKLQYTRNFQRDKSSNVGNFVVIIGRQMEDEIKFLEPIL